MAEIFLSYAREDRACAERLARVLAERGHEVWWDRHIDGGEEFAAEIEAALDKADVVLVAWSQTSIKSRWVRDEASVGGDTGRLVPISIDGSRAPMGFRQFHTLDLNGWRGGKRDERTAELLQSVEGRLNGGKAAPGARSPAQSTGWSVSAHVKPRWALAAALLFLVAAGAGYFIINRANPTVGQRGLTIALLPFTTTSSDAELRDIAAQASDSVSHTLPESGLTVRRLTAVPKDRRQAGDFVISGELSRNGDKVLATVRMDDAAHGVTAFTRQFEATGSEIRDLPERIGAQVAGTIAWAAPLIELEIRHPSDPSVTADLLRQLDFLGDPLTGYQAARRAAAKDPNSAFAQVAVAFDTAFNLGLIPRDERAQAVADARRAADRALTLAPEFGDTHSVGCYLHSETQRITCEDSLRIGLRIDPDSPFLDAFLSSLLRSVGRFDEAYEFAQLSYARDPYVPTKIGWMLRSFESTGATTQADRLYQQGVRWWPEFRGNYFENRLLGLLARGDWRSIRLLEANTRPDARPARYTDSAALESALKSKSPAAANRACPQGEEYWLNLRCLVAYASLGDLDGAFALAERLYPNRIGHTPAESERIWLEAPDAVGDLELITSPATAPMRRDPRYLALAQRVGLLDYWRSGRLPDFCREKPEPICTQLGKPR